MTPPTSDRRIYDGISLDGGRQGLEVMHRDLCLGCQEGGGEASQTFLVFILYQEDTGGHWRMVEDGGGWSQYWWMISGNC